MADDPVNQQQFADDVAAAAAAGGGDAYANVGAMNNFQMPNVEDVWKLIEQMEGLSDEERDDIKKNLYNPQDGTPEDFLKRYAAPPGVAHTNWDYIIFFTMIGIVVLVFALFGYKLYKSVMAKELKKQSKLKNKQSKKSKKAN